eukprot:3405354-Amphidinium_carterae.1
MAHEIFSNSRKPEPKESNHALEKKIFKEQGAIIYSVLGVETQGDIGVYEHEMFEFEKRLPPWGTLDIKACEEKTSTLPWF